MVRKRYRFGTKVVKVGWGSYKVAYKSKRKTLRNSKMLWFKLKGSRIKYRK